MVQRITPMHANVPWAPTAMPLQWSQQLGTPQQTTMPAQQRQTMPAQRTMTWNPALSNRDAAMWALRNRAVQQRVAMWWAHNWTTPKNIAVQESIRRKNAARMQWWQ